MRVLSIRLLCLFDRVTRGKSHDEAVNEDRDDDKEVEHGMHQHVDGDATDGMEGIQEVQRGTRVEPKDVFALANHYKRLK